jgi:hypothetical protein
VLFNCINFKQKKTSNQKLEKKKNTISIAHCRSLLQNETITQILISLKAKENNNSNSHQFQQL